MNQMEIFKNPEFGSIRTFEQDGKVLFCGTDVAAALGYANPRKAVRDHTRCGTKCSIGVQTGKKADGSVSGDYMEAENSVTVSVQVVYEDGSTNPVNTTAEALMSCTMAYNYWQGGRGIGTLNLNGQEGYQIWKVEAETGSERYRTDGDQTYGSFTVTHFEWDNNPVTVYEGDPVDSYVLHNNARNPERTGYYRNLMWDENNEAILIKVYVKQKPTEDNLKVIYYDERFDDELYSYDINVKDGIDFTDITPTPPAAVIPFLYASPLLAQTIATVPSGRDTAIPVGISILCPGSSAISESTHAKRSAAAAPDVAYAGSLAFFLIFFIFTFVSDIIFFNDLS